MKYYFVRHGLAEELQDSDFNRELTEHGRGRVGTAARVMKRLNICPAKIFSSPRLRSLQTAQIIAEELGMEVVVTDAVNFGFDLPDIQQLTRGLGSDDDVMFVGHNPDMSLVVHKLTGSNVAMKKGGLARVDVFSRKARQGELVWLIAPKAFDALGDKAVAADVTDGNLAERLPDKLADSSMPLHQLIQRRWSPLGFDPDRRIEKPILMSILEAARWAASSSNLQPWRFIVAPKENAAEFKKVFSVLKEGNQPWAQNAAILMIAVAHNNRGPGVLNRHAGHDLGQAIAQMVLQALDHGIYVHQMGGFFPEKAREVYGIPEDYEPYTAIAFGYRRADLSHLSDAHRAREASQRQRQELGEMVFNGSWARRADFLD